MTSEIYEILGIRSTDRIHRKKQKDGISKEVEASSKRPSFVPPAVLIGIIVMIWIGRFFITESMNRNASVTSRRSGGLEGMAAGLEVKNELVKIQATLDILSGCLALVVVILAARILLHWIRPKYYVSVD